MGLAIMKEMEEVRVIVEVIVMKGEDSVVR